MIASRGYHVYEETAWSDAKVNNKIEKETKQSSIATDPYMRAQLKQNKRILMAVKPLVMFREKFRVAFIFLSKKKVEGSVVIWNLWSKPSPVLSRGFEVPLLLTFSCPGEWVRNKMKDFINDFYTYDFTGIIHNDDSSDDSSIEIDLEPPEKEDDKEEASAPVADDEVTSKLLRQDRACIVIDDD